MQLQIPVVDNGICKQLISKLNADDVNVQITDRVICARLAGDKGVWCGDSGGPLMLPIFQNGLFPFYLIGKRQSIIFNASLLPFFICQKSPNVLYFRIFHRNRIEDV